MLIHWMNTGFLIVKNSTYWVKWKLSIHIESDPIGVLRNFRVNARISFLRAFKTKWDDTDDVKFIIGLITPHKGSTRISLFWCRIKIWQTKKLLFFFYNKNRFHSHYKNLSFHLDNLRINFYDQHKIRVCWNMLFCSVLCLI